MFNVHRSFSLSTGIKGTTIAVLNEPRKTTVIYHKTVVVEATPKRIVLRNGGWDTISTRHVINTALDGLNSPYRLIRHKNETLICPISEKYNYPDHKTGRPFVSGATIKREVQA